MKSSTKLIINTVAVSILFLSLIAFFLYFFYTQDLKRREIDILKEVGKFIVSSVDERLGWVKDASGEEIIRDTVALTAEYYDLGEHIHVLVFHSRTGIVVYPFSSKKRDVDPVLLKNTNEGVEGDIFLEDKLGYFFQYKKHGLTFFIYTLTGELFQYRNRLIYLVIGLFFLCALCLIIVENGAMKGWRYLVMELTGRFEKGHLRKQSIIKDIPVRFGPEIEDVLKGYNRLVTKSASFLNRLEGKLKECLKRRENLKKLVMLYRKHVANKELLSYNENTIGDLSGKRQDVASLTLELVGFLEPIGELYPQVITDELSRLHSFVKSQTSSHGGMINFYNGYYFNVVYGVPSFDKRAFLNAIRGSKAVLDWIETRNSSEENRSGIKWELKMGLAYGTAVIGTVGDSFVVIGEVVERSKRMLEHAKFYGVPLVTDSESELSRFDQVRYRRLDLVSTGNETLPEAYVYEIFLSEHPGVNNVIKLYSHGLEMFFEGKYDVALFDFKKVKKILGDDSPSNIFLERCERMIKG